MHTFGVTANAGGTLRGDGLLVAHAIGIILASGKTGRKGEYAFRQSRRIRRLRGSSGRCDWLLRPVG